MSLPVTQNNRGNFTWVPVAVSVPPPMTTPESEKGEAYHNSWARYFLSRQIGMHIDYFRSNYMDNMAYAIDSRWGEDDDIRMFLGDGPEQTSRIPFKFPIISPMLSRMVGGADGISIRGTAEPVTQYMAQTRREDAYAKAMVLSMAAAQGPMTAAAYEDQGISPDPKETESILDMTYQDHVIRGANSLMASLSERARLDDTRRTVAAYMAMSGSAAIHCFQNGQNIEAEVCEPREYGWDTSSMRPDHSDGQFMYVCPLVSVSAIAERWSPKADMIRALDTWSRILPAGYNFNAGWPQSRPRVFTMYWKDMKYADRGYVMVDGEPVYVTLGQIDDSTGKPKYTESDLIEPPSNEYTEDWTAAEIRAKKQRRGIEIMRYCAFIPWEYLPGGYTKGRPYNTKNAAPQPPENSGIPYVGLTGDMVFDYGECTLQEADADDVFSVQFPIKVSTWRYIGGHVVAPLTAARDPQRWLNQITSDAAWRLRKSGGKATLIAKEAVDGSNMDEDEVAMKIKEGDTLVLPSAMLGGLQNASGQIDSSPGPGFYNLLGVLPQMKSIAEGAVGVYDINYGAPQAGEQSGAAMQTQLQNAGVQQQPYMAAIADLYRQVQQFFAMAGKQFYAKRPWMLKQIAGDEDTAALIISDDMQLEQLRVKVELGPSIQQQRMTTDMQLIPQLMNLGMLDPVTASELMGRAVPQDVYAAARKFTKQAADAAAKQQEAAMAQQAAAGMQAEQDSIDQETSNMLKAQGQQEMNDAKLRQKETQPYRQAESEWLKPEKESSKPAPQTPGT